MNKLTEHKRAQILGLLIEGGSLRSASRLADVSINTVTKLLIEIGGVCAEFLGSSLVDLPCWRAQTDEIWSFCDAKQNVPGRIPSEFGYRDIWMFTAICADTKLVVSWMIGPRDSGTATEFMQDVAGRLRARAQVTTDGHSIYQRAVEDAFGTNGDLARPDPKHISASYVERQNLTMRLGIRRYTRLTNAFSKRIANHMAAVALHFMHYNFCRIHKSLRVTPAMAAGVSDHVWSLEDIVRLLATKELEGRRSRAN